jgi:hypothetical protein
VAGRLWLKKLVESNIERPASSSDMIDVNHSHFSAGKRMAKRQLSQAVTL